MTPTPEQEEKYVQRALDWLYTYGVVAKQQHHDNNFIKTMIEKDAPNGHEWIPQSAVNTSVARFGKVKLPCPVCGVQPKRWNSYSTAQGPIHFKCAR